MRAGETEALLQLLTHSGIPVSPQIQSIVAGIQKNKQPDLADSETWIQIQLQIYRELLSLPAFSRSESKPVVLKRAQIENLVLQHKIDEALEQCKPLGDSILLLHAQWSLLQKKHVSPGLDTADWELEVNKIKHGIMTHIERWTERRDGLRNWWSKLWKRVR